MHGVGYQTLVNLLDATLQKILTRSVGDRVMPWCRLRRMLCEVQGEELPCGELDGRTASICRLEGELPALSRDISDGGDLELLLTLPAA